MYHKHISVFALKNDEPPSEDDEGEETPVLKEGVFANQQFAWLKSKCLQENVLFVDPQFPPSPYSLYARYFNQQALSWSKLAVNG